MKFLFIFLFIFLLEFSQNKKAFWRKPVLHHDIPIDNLNDITSNFKPHRGEIWYELFYDLIYVAAAGEIGKLAEHDTSPWSLIKCGVIFAVMRDVSYFYYCYYYHSCHYYCYYYSCS